MQYKVKLHAFADSETMRRKVKHVEANGFSFDHGDLIFHADGKQFFAIAAGDWYQVSIAST